MKIIENVNRDFSHLFFSRILEHDGLFSLNYSTFDEENIDEDDVIIHKLQNDKIILLEIGERVSSEELKKLIEKTSLFI